MIKVSLSTFRQETLYLRPELILSILEFTLTDKMSPRTLEENKLTKSVISYKQSSSHLPYNETVRVLSDHTSYLVKETPEEILKMMS